MKYIKYFIFIISLFNFSLSNAENIDLQNKITKNLRCLICQGQSVYDSDSEFAISLKVLIKKKIEEGQNENQIYDFLKNKYGEWILYDPEFNKNTYFLWLFPLMIFIIGGRLVYKIFIMKKN